MTTQTPIFVFGNRRSGTTLIRLMLTTHPNISIPPEGDFIVRLGWKYDAASITAKLLNSFLDDFFLQENVQDWELTRDSLQSRVIDLLPISYPEMISEIYREYSRVKFAGKKSRWGDKTTWYNQYIPQIQSYFPEMKAIHLVRDVRAVAASYKGVSHLSNNPLESTLDWMWNNHLIERAKRKFPSHQWCLVRYEDLVEDPREELVRICAFLNETYDPGMLDFWQNNSQNNLEPERHLAWKMKTLEKVSTAQINTWKNILGSEEIELINQMAGRSLRLYGYGITGNPAGFSKNLYLGIEKTKFYFIRNLMRSLKEIRGRLNFRLVLPRRSR